MVSSNAAIAERVTVPSNALMANKYEYSRVTNGMARNSPGSHAPPRSPMTKKLARQNTAICSEVNNNPAVNL